MPDAQMAEFRGLQKDLRDVSDDHGWQALQRVTFRHVDETTLADLGSAGVALSVDGDPAAAIAHLADYLDLDRRLRLASESGISDPFNDPNWIPHPLERDVLSKIAGGSPVATSGRSCPLSFA